MTIDDAIKHCKDIINNDNYCASCVNYHVELLAFLEELKELREFKEKNA